MSIKIKDIPYDVLDLIMKEVKYNYKFGFTMLFVSKKFNRLCKNNNIKIYTHNCQYSHDYHNSYYIISISYNALKYKLPNIAWWAIENKLGPTDLVSLIPLLISFKYNEELLRIINRNYDLKCYVLDIILSGDHYEVFTYFITNYTINSRNLDDIIYYVNSYLDTKYLDHICGYLSERYRKKLTSYNNKTIDKWLINNP